MTSHIEGTREFEVRTADGTCLFVRDWPVTTAQGDHTSPGIVLMHGLGEHCGRYAHVARFFNALGFTVRTYDHRGHGRSGGAAGDVPDNSALLTDAQLIITDFSQQLAQPPLLLGHSMGGLFAARFATAGLAPLRGLILSSPALAIQMSQFQQSLLKIASALIPGVGIPNGLKTRFLSHDGEVIRAYENDHLVHPKISARLLGSMLAAMEYTHANAGQLHIPVLLLAAEDDHLVDPAGSRRWAEQVRLAGNITSHFYAGFYHEIFNELDATSVFDDLRTWMEQQHFTPVETVQKAA